MKQPILIKKDKIVGVGKNKVLGISQFENNGNISASDNLSSALDYYV